MWAIMKQFNVLPNDPLLGSMTIEQRDFVLLSMREDVKEAERASRGVVLDGDYNDKDFEDTFYSSTADWDIMRDGQDAEDIYKQVAERTKDKDYEKKLESKIHDAKTNMVNEKNKELQDITEMQAKNIEDALKRAKEKEEKQKVDNSSLLIDYDDDDDWDEI